MTEYEEVLSSVRAKIKLLPLEAAAMVMLKTVHTYGIPEMPIKEGFELILNTYIKEYLA